VHKIDTDGATGSNTFTEGNASLNIAATVVGDAWLNDVQGELVTVIENLGLTLTKGNITQLYDALIALMARGGRPAPISFPIANLTATAQDVVGFPTFDRTLVQSIEFLYSIFRRTDTGVKKEMGRAYLFYNTETNAWESPTGDFFVGDGGVVLSVAVDPGDVSGNTFKLQYTSDDLTGGTYSGTLRITDIKEIRF